MLCCLRLIRHVYASYPTYICFLENLFLNDIFCSTTYHTKQHIFFNNIFCYSTYMNYTTYLFNNIYMFLSNIYMLLNFIGHMYT